jgi:hypothetical protein
VHNRRRGRSTIAARTNFSRGKHGKLEEGCGGGSDWDSDGFIFEKEYPAGVLATGVGLAVLASEFPEKFEKVRQLLPDYFERSMRVMEMAARAGKRISDAVGRHRCVGRSEWVNE